MTNDFVLYCKSYLKDFLRVKRLLESLRKHNKEAIPFYISTPESDRDILFELLGGGKDFHWVSDESIVQSNPRVPHDVQRSKPGGISQQVIKSEFWRLGLAKNYLCIDSDSIFIKDFVKVNFLAPDGEPYTVLHQNKEFFQLASNLGHLRVERDLRNEAETVKVLFGRVGPNYYCAPAPFIWSAKVWESLEQNYLQPQGITLWDLISTEHPESLIYGEALLKYQAIPIRMIEPLFRIYHYDWQYYLSRRLGETEDKLQQNFIGVIYQSAWEVEMDFGAPIKSLPSRTLRKLKRITRLVQSYL
jgi:hypothetical protein